MDDFTECATCRPEIRETPTLCASCLANRSTIERLNRERDGAPRELVHAGPHDQCRGDDYHGDGVRWDNVTCPDCLRLRIAIFTEARNTHRDTSRHLQRMCEERMPKAEALRLTERIAKLERWVEHLRCAHEAARLIAGRVFEEVDDDR